MYDTFDIYVLCEYGLSSPGARATCSLHRPYVVRCTKKWVTKARPALQYFNMAMSLTVKAMTGLSVHLPFLTDEVMSTMSSISDKFATIEDLAEFLDSTPSSSDVREIQTKTVEGYNALRVLLEEQTTWKEVIKI